MPGIELDVAVVDPAASLPAVAAAWRASSRAWKAEIVIQSPIRRIAGIVTPANTANSFNPTLLSRSPPPSV